MPLASALREATDLVADPGTPERYALALAHLRGVPLVELLTDYVVLHRAALARGIRPLDPNSTLTRAQHLVTQVVEDLDNDDAVIGALVEYAASHAAADAVTAAELLHDVGHGFTSAAEVLFGLLTREVYDALRWISHPGQVRARYVYLSRRLPLLDLDPAETTMARLLLADWPGTEPELVASVRARSSALSPRARDLVVTLAETWSTTLDALVETAHLLALAD